MEGQQLVDSLNKREVSAFETLFHTYYGSLCFFAAQIIKDEDAARDLVQEVFIRFWEKETHFENPIALKSFLYECVRNKALNYLEKQNIRKRILEKMEPPSSFDNDTFTQMIQAELYRRISDAINELPGQCQRVFIMSYMERKNIKEIAEALSISSETVKTQRRRAKAFLRNKLGSPTLLLMFYLVTHDSFNMQT